VERIALIVLPDAILPANHLRSGINAERKLNLNITKKKICYGGILMGGRRELDMALLFLFTNYIIIRKEVRF
jgi:hypothetical protein